MYRSHPRKKRASRPIESVSQVLPTVGRQLHLDQKVQEWSVLALWEQIVDSAFQNTTRALKIQSMGGQKQLVVLVTNHALASELTFCLEEYRDRLNGFFPQTGLKIDKIKLRMGA